VGGGFKHGCTKGWVFSDHCGGYFHFFMLMMSLIFDRVNAVGKNKKGPLTFACGPLVALVKK